MAKNNSEFYVHAHVAPGTTVVVAPGEDFPEGYDADPSFTGEQPEAEDLVVPGPAQTVAAASVAPEGGLRSLKVAELREALDAAGVEYSADDRKDALIEKAEAAGLGGSEG